ncbi:MAG: dTMP kinase [Desulforhopalus sp.]|nr:dTMP kinase [Desulforhopalus sp.]
MQNTHCNRGLFIVFEGADGTGKSSQLRLLAQWLENSGYHVLMTREPSDGRHGRALREHFYSRSELSPEKELEMFLQDRRDHLENCIQPALAEGTFVLCDRYFLSTVAYQSLHGFSTEFLLKENEFAPAPDIAFILQAPLATCLRRITTDRGEQPNDFETRESLEKVDTIFQSLSFPWIRRIDSSGGIDDIQQKLQKDLMPLLNNIKRTR